MVDVKEITSVKIVPYTLISSLILAILALIIGIIFAIAAGIIVLVLPPPLGGFLAGLGAATVIAFPIWIFFSSLSVIFFTVLLYNWLVPRVGGVKLSMDGNNVVAFPVKALALIISIIMAIWAFIIGVFLATATAPLLGAIGTSIPLIANATNTSFTGAAFGMGTAVLYVSLIIIMPIVVFIIGFIYNALSAIFYNYIATRATKLQLNFEPMTEGWNSLTYVPIAPAAISIAIVFTIWGLIQGIISFATLAAAGDPGAGIIALIYEVVRNFIMYLIGMAIATWLYNWFAPRIGAFKLKLE